MAYLLVSGATRTVAKHAGHPHLGRFIQPRSGNDINEIASCGMIWAADNDALGQACPDAYLAMIGMYKKEGDMTRKKGCKLVDDGKLTLITDEKNVVIVTTADEIHRLPYNRNAEGRCYTYASIDGRQPTTTSNGVTRKMDLTTFTKLANLADQELPL